LSVEEIATVTGVTRETAKSRLRYALAKLRASLSAPADAQREPG
jgi:RNA polymerase sigma-70 factor (ECF subfamily)